MSSAQWTINGGPSPKDTSLGSGTLGITPCTQLIEEETKDFCSPLHTKGFCSDAYISRHKTQQQEFQVPISVDTRPQALSCLGCSTGIPFQNPGGPLPISLVSLPLPMLWACGHAARRLNVPTL